MPDDLFLMIEPSWQELLKPTAKMLWKKEHHDQRYERRFGHREPMPTVSVGTLQGVRFID